MEFQILQIGIPIWWVFNSWILKKGFRPEYLESEMESEFRFWLGSQKLEPKIGIPNLGDVYAPDK